MESKKSLDIEKVISLILRVGVVLSIAVISFGLLAHILVNAKVASLIIKVGLYILFLTPFARLVVSLFMFLLEKDLIYFAITMAIIVIIVLSNMVVSLRF
ncbi:DUF1634 domain-containing protein [Caldicellulosiruptor changbaiensis]|uniref:DUF1634 domain-containing protein n=1 Tax=Caldicellulosiruptor changbaiensis TaxID=1222016 RepID=A0A3T0D362_9FIRM|nr:DUF1634 domain-containing protein [Caldicellulosiruptor changbaiensis]AZT89655.1 DUF1634 domain-containing protein [Caldicellulosiruptor changbaiensis]